MARSRPPVSDRRVTRRRPAPRRPRYGPGVIIAVTAVAVIVVAGLIMLSQSGPGRRTTTVASSGKIKGDPNAPVTIEEWGDFQCPACAAYALGVGRQLEESVVASGQAKTVWRHMVILGPESQRAAEAAECAAEQDRFWDYHDRLFRSQAGENRGAFNDANLKRFAADLSLDTAAFNACLDSGQTRAKVEADTAAGRQKGVGSTPTIFVNDQKIQGVPRFDMVRQLVETLAAAARTPATKP